MSTDAAVLFTFLDHHFDAVVKHDLPRKWREAGWCWCTAETVERYLGWDSGKQKRVLAKLKERGFVETEQHRKRDKLGRPMPGPPVRWVRCHVTRVTVALEEEADRAYFEEEETVDPGRLEFDRE